MILHVQSAIKCGDQPAGSHDISAASFQKAKLQQDDWHVSKTFVGLKVIWDVIRDEVTADKVWKIKKEV